MADGRECTLAHHSQLISFCASFVLGHLHHFVDDGESLLIETVGGTASRIWWDWWDGGGGMYVVGWGTGGEVKVRRGINGAYSFISSSVWSDRWPDGSPGVLCTRFTSSGY